MFAIHDCSHHNSQPHINCFFMWLWWLFAFDDCFQSRSAHQSGKSFVESPSWWSLYCFPCFLFSTSGDVCSISVPGCEVLKHSLQNSRKTATHHLDRFQAFTCSTPHSRGWLGWWLWQWRHDELINLSSSNTAKMKPFQFLLLLLDCHLTHTAATGTDHSSSWRGRLLLRDYSPQHM